MSKTAQNQPYRRFRTDPGFDREFPFRYTPSYLNRQTEPSLLQAHSVLELGYCHSGEGIFVIEGQVLPYREGDVSFIPPMRLHLAQSRKELESHWSWVHVDVASILETGVEPELSRMLRDQVWERIPGVLSGKQHPLLNETMRQIVEEFQSRHHGFQGAVRALLGLLFVRLFRTHKEGKLGVWPGQVSSLHPVPGSLPGASALERVAPAVAEMTRRHGERLEMKSLADGCKLSVTHFRRLFETALGQSPQEYLTRLRISMACSILAHSLEPVSRVAEQVGYRTLSSFNRAFRQVTGKSPRQWRRMA